MADESSRRLSIGQRAAEHADARGPNNAIECEHAKVQGLYAFPSPRTPA